MLHACLSCPQIQVIHPDVLYTLTGGNEQNPAPGQEGGGHSASAYWTDSMMVR